MKLQREHVAYIKKSFSKMKDKEDLLRLLNFTKTLLYGEKAMPFEIKHLNFHCNPKNNKSRYRTFEINKKSGGKRIIYAPNAGLAKIQQCLNLIFQALIKPHTSAKGFVSGQSIVDNASVHIGRNYVYNIDLKDFFHSIDQARIWGRLQHYPFNLNKKRKNLELANMIAALCCHEIEVERVNADGNWEKIVKNVLPQGAPTSPILSNIVCARLDYYLSKAAHRFGLNYTRYADDITFSSMHNMYTDGNPFIIELNRIILQENFFIKESKTRLQKINHRQEVTGLIVNNKPNVRQKYLKEIRKWLYYWERYGYERANTFYYLYYSEISSSDKKIPTLKRVIRGKLDFLKMVKGGNNIAYLALRNRYDNLISEHHLVNKLNTDRALLIEETTTRRLEESLELESTEYGSTNTQDLLELPFVHKPKELVEYLKQFSLNGTVLKYATHSWDGGKDEEVFKDFDDFLIKVKEEFKRINKLKKLNERLWAKILSFLLNKNVGEEGWGINRIKFGWSAPELLNAMRADPTQKPENFIIPINSQFHLKTYAGTQFIQKFQQVIDIFKNEIEIRDENSALLELILDCHDRYLNNFKIIKISNLENKNFYTDVDYFRKALNLVFENIRKRDTHKDVSYLVKEDPNKLTLEILHHQSLAKGRSIHDPKLSLKFGDMGTIKGWLTNLCDWSIESEFLEGSYRINYLVSNSEIAPYQEIDDAEGFKYIFTFYK